MGELDIKSTNVGVESDGSNIVFNTKEDEKRPDNREMFARVTEIKPKKKKMDKKLKIRLVILAAVIAIIVAAIIAIIIAITTHIEPPEEDPDFSSADEVAYHIYDTYDFSTVQGYEDADEEFQKEISNSSRSEAELAYLKTLYAKFKLDHEEYEDAVNIAEDVNPEVLNRGGKAIYYSVLMYAYSGIGNTKKTDEARELFKVYEEVEGNI